jgi:hypothetical protein
MPLLSRGETLTLSHPSSESRMMVLQGGQLIDSRQLARLVKTRSLALLSNPRNPPRPQPSLEYHKNSTMGCNENLHQKHHQPLIERLRRLRLLSQPRQDHVMSPRSHRMDLEATALGQRLGCAR